MKLLDTVFVYRLHAGERSHSSDRLNWHGRYHAHGSDEFELHFFLEGSLSFQCNRTKYPVSPGRLFLTGPYDFHSILPEAVSTPVTYYAVLFSLDSAGSSVERSLRQSLYEAIAGRAVILSIDAHFRFQFEDLLLMSKSADPALNESALHLLQSFLYRWFCRSSSLQGEARLEERKTNRLHAQKALALMEKQVRENILVEDFARKLGLSDEHFIRVFRDEVRMTPHQYFTRLKVEGASGMLMSTDKSVGEISDWFGFENQFHFSRIFKKCTGMSPLQYRRTYLQIVDFS